jgi:hypothetical protein
VSEALAETLPGFERHVRERPACGDVARPMGARWRGGPATNLPRPALG